MKPLSETPRTDAQMQLDAKRYHGHSKDYVSLSLFTKQLERELNEHKAIHKTASGVGQRIFDQTMSKRQPLNTVVTIPAPPKRVNAG